MLRKTLTILSLISLLLSVGLWGVSYLDMGHRGQKYTWGITMGAVFWMHDEHHRDYQPSEAPQITRKPASAGLSNSSRSPAKAGSRSKVLDR